MFWMPLALVLALLLAACGDSTPPAGEAAPPPVAETADEEPEGDGEESPAERSDLERVRVQLGWFGNASYSPVFLAVERGYFAEEGLDALVFEGGRAAEASAIVAFGGAEVALDTLDSVAFGVAEGMPLVAVATLERYTPATIIVPADSDIQEPKDLEGKTVGALPTGASGVLFEPFLERSGVDISKVDRQDVSPQTQVPLLVTGEVDAITGFTRSNAVDVEIGHDMEVRFLPYGDVGLRVLSQGIYTTETMIEEKPDVVSGVVKAIIRGYEAAIEDPQAAIEAAALHYPDHYENMELALEQATRLAALIDEQAQEATDGVVGPNVEEEWAVTLDLLETYFGLADVKEPSEYYTNDFLP